MSKAKTTALYAEFRRETFTYQMLLFPETFDFSDDTVTPFTSMFRQLSVNHPRREWKFSSADKVESLDRKGDTAEAVAYSLAKLVRSLDTLDSLERGQWKLHAQPIAVEVADDEFEEVLAGKNPAGLIRRVLRARDAAKYGDLIQTVVGSPVAPASAGF